MFSQNRGYTFLELILTLTLIAMLTAFATPLYQQLIDAYHISLLQSALKESIHIARLSAETTHLPIGICPSNNQHTCGARWSGGLLIFKDQQQGRVSRDTQIITFIPFPVTHGVLFWRAYPHYRHYLRFMPVGQWVDNGVFWYCSKKETTIPTFAIVLNRLGEARLVLPVQGATLTDSRGQVLSCKDNNYTYQRRGGHAIWNGEYQ